MTTITPSQVKDFLKRHFQDKFKAKGIDPERVNDDFNLMQAGIVDSFGVISMITAIEREFRMEIDLENLNPDDIAVMGRFCQFVADSHNSGETKS